MRLVARVLVILLGVGLMVAAGFGFLFAEVGFGQVSHTEQGYSCPNPNYAGVCTGLAAQEQFWQGVFAIAIVAFVAGPFILIFLGGRRVGLGGTGTHRH